MNGWTLELYESLERISPTKEASIRCALGDWLRMREWLSSDDGMMSGFIRSQAVRLRSGPISALIFHDN